MCVPLRLQLASLALAKCIFSFLPRNIREVASVGTPSTRSSQPVHLQGPRNVANDAHAAGHAVTLASHLAVHPRCCATSMHGPEPNLSESYHPVCSSQASCLRNKRFLSCQETSPHSHQSGLHTGFVSTRAPRRSHDVANDAGASMHAGPRTSRCAHPLLRNMHGLANIRYECAVNGARQVSLDGEERTVRKSEGQVKSRLGARQLQSRGRAGA